jgi:hypothetical protein
MFTRLIFLLTLMILAPGRLPAQDILFKSNGEKIKVHILERDDRAISYSVPGQIDSPVHHISTSVLDSVLFEDGNRLVFAGKQKIPFLPEIPAPVKYGHNLVGFDWAAAAFYNSIAVSYEHLLWNYRLGIKAVYGQKLKYSTFYDNSLYGQQKGSYFRAGVNWYIFPPGSFRFGAGLHFVLNHYHVIGQQYANNDGTINNIDEFRNNGNLILAFLVCYQVFRNLAVNAGLDMLNKKPFENKTVLRAEVLVNF